MYQIQNPEIRLSLIKQYSQLTYLQFCIRPAILTNYIKCLVEEDMNHQIHQIFKMLIETFYQFTNQICEDFSKLSPISKILYKLIVQVSIVAKFNQQFWNPSISSSFYQLLIKDLIKYYQSSQHKTYLSSLLSYFQMNFILYQIKYGASKNISTTIDNFKNSYYSTIQQHLLQIQSLSPNIYSHYESIYSLLYNKIIFIIQQSNNKNQKNQIIPSQIPCQVCQSMEAQSINNFYFFCQGITQKYKFLQKNMIDLMKNLNWQQISEVKLLNKLFLQQYKNDSCNRSNIYCNLASINICQQIISNKKNRRLIIEQGIKMYKQIVDIEKPHIIETNIMVSFLIMLGCQNDQNDKSLQIVYQFNNYLLRLFQIKIQNQQYIKMLLRAILIQIYLSKGNRKQKIQQFWSKIDSHYQIISQINAQCLLNLITSLWVISNWNNIILKYQCIVKSQKVNENLKQLVIDNHYDEIKIQKSKENHMKNIISKLKMLFQHRLNDQKRVRIAILQIYYYFLQENYQDCLDLSLKAMQVLFRNVQMSAQIAKLIDCLMIIIFVCLNTLNKKYESYIMIDLSQLTLNYQQVEKDLSNTGDSFQFDQQWIDCIRSFDMVEILGKVSKVVKYKICEWVDKEENYQWTTQSKRKKIKYNKVKKFIKILMKQ